MVEGVIEEDPKIIPVKVNMGQQLKFRLIFVTREMQLGFTTVSPITMIFHLVAWKAGTFPARTHNSTNCWPHKHQECYKVFEWLAMKQPRSFPHLPNYTIKYYHHNQVSIFYETLLHSQMT